MTFLATIAAVLVLLVMVALCLTLWGAYKTLDSHRAHYEVPLYQMERQLKSMNELTLNLIAHCASRGDPAMLATLTRIVGRSMGVTAPATAEATLRRRVEAQDGSFQGDSDEG